MELLYLKKFQIPEIGIENINKHFNLISIGKFEHFYWTMFKKSNFVIRNTVIKIYFRILNLSTLIAKKNISV